jgi:hypothetical protein
VKDEYVAFYGKKYFHWIPSTARNKDKYYFTTKDELIGEDGQPIQGYQLSEEFYKRHESVVRGLIHNTQKDSEL